MWGAGVSQGLLWLNIDELGELRYSFTDIMAATVPYYLIRLLAGLVFLAGALLMAYNLYRTVSGKRTIEVHAPPVQATAGATA